METILILIFGICIYLITVWRLVTEFKNDRNKIVASHSTSMSYLIEKIKQNSKQHARNKKEIRDILKKIKQSEENVQANYNQNFAAHEQLKDEIRINETNINKIMDNDLVHEELSI